VTALFHLFRQVPYHKFLLRPETYLKPFQTFYHSLGDFLARGFFVVTVSEFWRQKLIGRGFSQEKIRVIPVGADWPDDPRISPEEAKERLGLSGRFVVYTSPFRLNKGVLNVLKAVELLKDRFPGLKVLVSGVTDDRTRQQVERYLRQHRLEDYFQYVGLVPRERLPLYYLASDVVVLASLEEEGWGITLLEGMISGKPVVAGAMGALPELVAGRGILLKKNTVQDLAGALEDLIRSPELRERLGAAGPPFARQFSYQAAARAHLRLFEELLKGS
jgi:glycosyltransferase involved in cell wall biosynthesis